MTDKLTMAAIWEELTPEERKAFAMMVGVDQGQLALTKLSAALKAVMYRYYDKPIVNHPQMEADALQRQIEMTRQQYEHQLKQMEYEMRRRYEHELQRTYVSDNTLDPLSKEYRKLLGGKW